MEHSVDCVLNATHPLETGEDGRAVLEIILAAYESAGTGRKVTWPYAAPRDKTGAEVLGG
jgi:predicted dehydrogenase